MSNVSLKKVCKSYDNKKSIINNIDLEIADKEFIVLVGASGCGKSTILRMIAGLEEITSGEIFIDNKVVNNVHPKDRDIAFGLKMRKVDKKIIDEKVKEAAKVLDLTQYLDRKPKQLSGGQRQRVALGRAMVRNPKVFLMDEPLSNLDAKLRVQMRSEIKKLHKKLDTTFIYVTHDQTEALTMGDRIVVLDKGVIQQVDTPSNIYSNPANTFVAGFIGQMNFIDAQIVSEGLKFNDVVVPLSDDIKSNLGNRDELVIGIRPENMTSGDIKFVVDVEISEMLGSEKIAYFELQNKKCSAKLAPDYEIGEQIELSIKSENMLFFDKKTGENIIK